MTDDTMEDSNLVKHAVRELDLVGETDDWARDAILSVVRTFARSGHSGSSAAWATAVLSRLLAFKPLTPLTDDPAEWNHIAEEMAGRPDLWQNARDSEAFSYDGGKTYYLLSEREKTPEGVELSFHNSEPRS